MGPMLREVRPSVAGDPLRPLFSDGPPVQKGKLMLNRLFSLASRCLSRKTNRGSLSKTRNIHLTLEPLENRVTPATFSYAPTTGLLTIVADTDDNIVISQQTNKPVGFLRVNDGSSNIFDGTNLVKDIKVDLRNDQFSNLTVNDGVRLAGSLTVLGGPITNSVTLGSTSGVQIGKNFTVIGTGTSNDDVTINQLCQIGGAVTLSLGEGSNLAMLRGFLGSLKYTGGAFGDTVNLAPSGSSLITTGDVSISMGAGSNSSGTSGLVQIAGNLTFTGGIGTDNITTASGAGQDLFVGKNLTFNLGTAAAGNGNNSVNLNLAHIAGKVTANGGSGGDSFFVAGNVLIGGSLTGSLGEGNNVFNLDGGSSAVRILGALTYTGGSGLDDVDLDTVLIGGSMSAALKDNIAGGLQEIEFTNLTVIQGSLNITGGKNDDRFDMEDIYVGGSVSCNGGIGGNDTINPDGMQVAGNMKIVTGIGVDTVILNDLWVAGSLYVSTGASGDTIRANEIQIVLGATFNGGTGDDLFHLETLANAGDSSYGGPTTFIGGIGTDTLLLGTGTGLIRFGGKVSLIGGIESDIINTADSIFTNGTTGTW